MGTTATDQFISSTYCAKRWMMNLGPNITNPTPGGVKGYVIELTGFGENVPPFIAVVGYRHAAGDYRLRVVKVANGPVPLDFNNLSQFANYIQNNTYAKLKFPSSIDTDEECALYVERFVGMIMHGKLGPHNSSQWRAKWRNFVAGAEEEA